MPVDHVILRPCTEDDASALSLVACATFLDAYAGFIDGQAIVAFCKKHHNLEAYAEYLARADCRAWLAEMEPGAAPVGYFLLTAPDLPLPSLTSQDIELKRIYLLSRLHRAGIGQRLMNQAVASAADMHATRLLLGVHQDNIRALRFYGRNGFESVGSRTFQVGSKVYQDLILGRAVSLPGAATKVPMPG